MSQEIFARVDEQDNIVGTTTKEEAHNNAHIHRVSAVYVFDIEGNILVQLRKKDGLLDHSAAGHLRQGENYDDGAKRELQEELGLIRDDLRKIGVFLSDERFRGTKPTVHYFGLYETTLGEDMITKEPSEVADMVPMKLAEVASEMGKNPKKFTPGFMMTLNFYIKNKKLDIPSVSLE